MTPAARQIRENIIRVSQHSGHGHIPTCFSIVEMLLSVYAGWILPKRVVMSELSDVSSGAILIWTWLIRFVAPILVLVVLMQKVGIIEVT